MYAPIELDETEARALEVDAFRSEFLRYAAMDNLRQPCPIGGLKAVIGLTERRRETIAEMIGSEMDYGDNLTRAVEIICKLARYSYEPEEAHKLLTDMASAWADKRSEL
jgi:hypothetical protein